MAKTFRILSIDGGGLRGIIPVLVLKELERRMGGKPIYQMFDLIAGTSTGGLIACAMTVSADGKNPMYTLDQIAAIYTQRGKEIFPKKNWLENTLNEVSSLKNPEFSVQGINKVLRDLLDHKRMMNCLCPLLVTSYDLYNNQAVFFKSRHAAINPMENAELYDVCRASSAAPTYLPAYDCFYNNKRRIFIDGGIFINNPSIAALVEASKYHSDPIYNKPDIKFSDICLLSIGTGHYSANISRKKVEKWGELDWAKPITDVMMQGVNQATSYEDKELLEDHQYLRIGLEIDDENHANMADSSQETMNYLMNETSNQILGNSVLMKQLDDFILKAGL